MSKVFIGTSGWMYSHWQGKFYPPDLPQRKWLEYYSSSFDTVEVNATFYHQMKRETFENWRRIVGSKFVFSIKGSRFITHIKRLKNCWEEVERFFEAAEGLLEGDGSCRSPAPRVTHSLTSGGPRVGLPGSRHPSLRLNVILWQLPPGMAFDKPFGPSSGRGFRLKNFLDILPKTFRHAFEFRNESWMDFKIFKILEKYKAAVVFQDYPRWPITEKVTTDFVYLRFHGKESLYASCYNKKELEEWAEKIKRWVSQGLDVYGYFNNDVEGYAPRNAKELKELLKHVF